MKTFLAAIPFALITGSALAFNIGMPPSVIVFERELGKITSPGDVPLTFQAYKTASADLEKGLGDRSNLADCVAPTMQTWKKIGAMVNGTQNDPKSMMKLVRTFKADYKACANASK